MCDSDAWKQNKGKKFACVNCGLRPFEEFLIDEQKRIAEKNLKKDVMCGRCLIPECSSPGCSNKSPKAIYRQDHRERYVCNTCQEQQKYTCTKCNRSFALDQFPAETQEQFKSTPGRTKQARRCLECEADKSGERQNFPCSECGLKPFADFLIDTQKRIRDGKTRWNTCGKCLLAACSKPGCTNKSPEAIPRREDRERYLCDTCKSGIRCEKCDAPALKNVTKDDFIHGSWYCGKKV